MENREEYNRLSELRNSVYNAEDIIDGEYSIGMYGDKYKEIDKMHSELIYLLREYDCLLEQILKNSFKDLNN